MTPHTTHHTPHTTHRTPHTAHHKHHTSHHVTPRFAAPQNTAHHTALRRTTLPGIRTCTRTCNCIRTTTFGTNLIMCRDEFDKNQDRMHLDTVFNVIDSKRVIALEDILGKESPKRRLVDVYVKGAEQSYSKGTSGVEFSEFLKEVVLLLMGRWWDGVDGHRSSADVWRRGQRRWQTDHRFPEIQLSPIPQMINSSTRNSLSGGGGGGG